jgi:hypothetical protein
VRFVVEGELISLVKVRENNGTTFEAPTMLQLGNREPPTSKILTGTLRAMYV